MTASVAEISASFLVKYPQFTVLPSTQIDAFAADALTNVPLTKLPERIKLQALVLKTGEFLSQGLGASIDGLKLKREKSSLGENEFFEAPSSDDFRAAYNALVKPYCLRSFAANTR